VLFTSPVHTFRGSPWKTSAAALRFYAGQFKQELFMKTFSLSLLALLPLSASAADFKVPQITEYLSGRGYRAQPCVQWWTSGACALYASDFDAADRAQVNKALRLLEKKIRELEKEIAALRK
jgi:hypothetical protein